MKDRQIVTGKLPLAPPTAPGSETKAELEATEIKKSRDVVLKKKLESAKVELAESVKYNRGIVRRIFGNLEMEDVNYLKQFITGDNILDLTLDDTLEIIVGLKKE